MIYHRPATVADALALAPMIRAADRREIETVSGEGPEMVLLRAVQESQEAWAVERDGRVLSIFGVSSFLNDPEIGTPWLVATDDVKRVGVYIRKIVPGILRSWLQVYPKGLHNAVDNRNHIHIRWLRHLGFSFLEYAEINGHLFHHFQLIHV